MLRDPRSGDPDRDPRDRDRRRGRGSNRDRGRSRYRDRGGRQSRPNDRHFDYPNRSPPSRASRFGPDPSRTSNDFPLDRSPPRGSPGPDSGYRDTRRSDHDHPRPSSSGDLRNAHTSGPIGKDTQGFRRDDSPFGPPSKRKRTRSPSPRGQRSQFPQRRSSFAKNGDRRDRSPPPGSRARFPGRGAPRGRSPHRGRDRRGKDRRRHDVPRSGRSRSPVRDREFRPSPDRRPRSPTDDYSDRDSRYRSRSLSRHSARSVVSKASAYSSHSRGDEGMHSIRPIKGVGDDHGRSLSPYRRNLSPNGSNKVVSSKSRANLRDAFPMLDMRASDAHNKQRRRPSRPHLETGSYSTSPHLKTPTRSHHGSPQPESPSGGRGGWKGPPSHSVSG